MQRQIAIVFRAALLALPASAQRSRPAKPVIENALSIVFVDTPAADSSLVAARGNHQRSARVLRCFGLRVVRTAGTASGMAAVTAHLESVDGLTSMRLDGKLLTETPFVIDARAAIGAVVVHTLEIEVSDSVAAGLIAAAVTGEVPAQ